ncbi:hypothetical protein Q8A67_019890 [Cirrhinus molitorella]|uniref:Uncharacterized protein n=1 Tax=Cirrhinus molitorella TaxID=172907 RepID=A0AA88TE34_9TELE|nr:hypothetical protein Q8A67_019890 [Cirrhinus molitorella]
MRSCWSIGIPPNLSAGTVTSEPEVKRDDVIRSVSPCLTYSETETGKTQCGTWRKVQDCDRTAEICM